MVGPGWTDVADVIASYHHRGEPTRVYGELVHRDHDRDPWKPFPHMKSRARDPD